MLPWLSLLVISSTVSWAHSHEAYLSSQGPTSASEALLLWQDGTKALEEAQIAELQSDKPLQKVQANTKYKDAASLLQRYVDRYPGNPHYLESHLYLGQAYLGLHQADKAAHALKYCVYSSQVQPLVNLKSRLSFAQANIEMEQYALAEAITNEAASIIQHHPEFPTELVQRISMLRAEALLHLNQLELSNRIIQNTVAQFNAQSSPEIKAEASLLQMKYQLKECSLLPNLPKKNPTDPNSIQGSLQEGQILDQMHRKGTCLTEALLPYRKALEFNIFPIARGATHTLRMNLNTYIQNCRTPEASWFVSKKARDEITDTLIDRCRTQLALGFEFLQGWKSNLPERIQNLITSIEDRFLVFKRKS